MGRAHSTTAATYGVGALSTGTLSHRGGEEARGRASRRHANNVKGASE